MERLFGALSLSGKVFVTFAMFVYFSVPLPSHISARFPLDGFHDIWYCGLLWKSDTIAQICLKSDKNIVHFTWRPELVLFLSTTLNHHKSVLFDLNRTRMLVRQSVRPSVLPSLSLSAHISADLTGQTHVKFYLEDFYKDLLRIFSTFSWNRTKLSGTLLYMMTQVGLLLPATLNRHKSSLLESNVMRLLGEPRRYKRYAKAPQRHVTLHSLAFINLKLD
jgi:hypothetical protein